MIKTQIDIILLHGNDNYVTSPIIEYLKESFGFIVNTVENSPARGKSQNDKVRSYIKECKLPIVLATFDGSNQNVRPNVANEIALCFELRQNDFLIIRERRNNSLAAIGSNIENQHPEIIFEKDDLSRLYIKLNREILALNLITKSSVKQNSDLNSIRKEANEISDFLDKMDRIWEDEFDIVADFIRRDDWKTEKEFQNKLDAFFLKYWAVFDAMIRKKKEGRALKKISDENLEEAYELAFDVWSIVVKSRLDALDEKMNKNKSAKILPECNKAEVDKLHKLVENMNRPGNSKRKSITINEMIKNIIAINDKISKCL